MSEQMSEMDQKCLEYGIELAYAANRAFNYRAAAKTASEYHSYNGAFNAFTSAVGALIGREVKGSETYFTPDVESNSPNKRDSI